jgi:hypothetical protein
MRITVPEIEGGEIEARGFVLPLLCDDIWCQPSRAGVCEVVARVPTGLRPESMLLIFQRA